MEWKKQPKHHQVANKFYLIWANGNLYELPLYGSEMPNFFQKEWNVVIWITQASFRWKENDEDYVYSCVAQSGGRLNRWMGNWTQSLCHLLLPSLFCRIQSFIASCGFNLLGKLASSWGGSLEKMAPARAFVAGDDPFRPHFTDNIPWLFPVKAVALLWSK